MERPDQWPNVPYAAFVDGIGPSINAAFLNILQEGLTDIIGALYGKSATLIADEFAELSWPAGKVGQLSVISSLNATATTTPPLGAGDHGLVKIAAVAGGPSSYVLQDAPSYLGVFDFSFSGKALVTRRAALNNVGTDGFVIGIRSKPAALGLDAAFVAGSDKANWQVTLKSTVYDTGVPVADGVFQQFQITRKNGTAYAFINGLLVATVAFPDPITNIVREIKLDAPAAGAGDGCIADYHRVWYQR